ncbi:MAG: NAD(P)-binding domain-containing protein [Cyclobacteriaceae bacterium]
MQRRICVIGAGPSGITALKNLLDEGLDVQCFDVNDRVGGNWLYSEEESHSSVFETTHIISSRSLSQYADYPFDEFDPTIPDYPSHEQLAAYFQAYAKRFRLEEHIAFSTKVLYAHRESQNKWLVELEAEGARWQEEFTDLVVCNGHHWNPRIPKYPGEFSGEFIHSHEFKKAEPFRNKRILVIGGGNSACDVAVETSRVSNRTAISMRRGYRIIPKFFFGKPTDVVGSGMKWLPIGLRNKLSEILLKIMLGSNEKYGLQKPDLPFGAVHPTTNDELLYKIRHGKVHPKVDIERFEGKTIHFDDGSAEEFDVVIACTGYKITHPFLDKNLIDYSEGEVPLYLKMMHPEFSDVFFVGLFQPLGCIWPGAELQSKIIARQLVGKWERPENIKVLVEKEVKNPHYKQVKTPRHTITVDYHLFRRALLKQLPKKWVRKG